MPLRDILLPEFDRETANTRLVLERVPEERYGWRPHPKSWTMGELASHLANLLGWTKRIIDDPSIDVAPPGGPPARRAPAASRQELLELFDSQAAEARAAIAGAGDEQLFQPWSLLAGGRPVFTLPRLAVLRGFVMNHHIHHRAQLGVCLRLCDLPVPALYGPSADEAPMG